MSSENNVVSFSGGKDSTALLLMMLEKGIPVHSAVFFDTSWEFDEMHRHLAEVEDYTGIKIVKLKPDKPFLYWMFERPIVSRKERVEKIGLAPPPKESDYDDDDDFRFDYECWELDPFEYKRIEIGEVHRIGNGWPSPYRRWCTRIKANALEAYTKSVPNAVRCIGFAADETHRAEGKELNKGNKAIRYPLIEWGITEAEALAYCQGKGFNWGGLYEHFQRVSCFCCPLQGLDELRQLRKHFPKQWATMLKWDAMQPRHNKGFKKYDTAHALEARFAEEDRFLKLPIAGNE